MMGGLTLYFTSKQKLLWTISTYGIVLGLWLIVLLTVYCQITGKKTAPSISFVLSKYFLISEFVLAVLVTWFMTRHGVSCGYTITEDYLIAKMGPIREKIKLSDIEIVRWGYGGKCDDGLRIRSKNDVLNILPEDVSGFLKLLRERCPTAEITTNEISPSIFSNDRPFDTISDREQAFNALDKNSDKFIS